MMNIHIKIKVARADNSPILKPKLTISTMFGKASETILLHFNITSKITFELEFLHRHLATQTRSTGQVTEQKNQ